MKRPLFTNQSIPNGHNQLFHPFISHREFHADLNITKLTVSDQFFCPPLNCIKIRAFNLSHLTPAAYSNSSDATGLNRKGEGER